MHRLICQKPAHFLSAQMALVSTFFQMFIVLGMYNFACHTNCGLVYSAMRKPECTAKSFCAYRDILPLLLAKAKFKS